MARIETALTRLLGIKHPILLAPMGSAAGGRLARAVTHAGGLGMIGSGYADSATIDRELAQAGNARVGVGFITWALDRNPDALDQALKARPAAVMLSFGSPTPHAASIKAAGVPLICQVQTLAGAVDAATAGADIVIAQGRDAGGHAGTTRGTMGLVPAVVDAIAPIPVVAAGGIADGRGLAAALALGAAGVLMGTRFAAAAESLWPEPMKRRAVEAGGDETEQTRVFDIARGAAWPPHFPGRAVRNAFSQRWHQDEAGLSANREATEKDYLAAPADDFQTRVVWAGEGVDLVKDVMTAERIIDEIVADAVSGLDRSSRLIVR
ncbi:MAG: nitronate monooxygenase [Alphaproteobacteria bacterium]|nr:nitronate monooxygenase [Alphaproteobacteria bacterium]